MLSSECLSQVYYSEVVNDLTSRVHSEKKERFAEYVKMLDRAGCKTGRVLDVGCNAGELLQLFHNLGWEVAGVEISPGPAALARTRLGATIWQGAVEDVLPEKECFGLVTLTHVLEHLLEPQSVLERLREALGNGVLLVEVPNAEDRLIKIWRGLYRQLCPGDHVSFFSESSLRTLLQRAGFDVIEVLMPTHARDLVYPSLLSSVDCLKHFTRLMTRRKAPGEAASSQGVFTHVRYRGKLRVPLRRVIDSTCARLDPFVVAATQRYSATGPVLIATARSRTNLPHV